MFLCELLRQVKRVVPLEDLDVLLLAPTDVNRDSEQLTRLRRVVV